MLKQAMSEIVSLTAMQKLARVDYGHMKKVIQMLNSKAPGARQLFNGSMRAIQLQNINPISQSQLQHGMSRSQEFMNALKQNTKPEFIPLRTQALPQSPTAMQWHGNWGYKR